VACPSWSTGIVHSGSWTMVLDSCLDKFLDKQMDNLGQKNGQAFWTNFSLSKVLSICPPKSLTKEIELAAVDLWPYRDNYPRCNGTEFT